MSEIYNNIPPELTQYIRHLEEENKSLKQTISNLDEMLFNSRKKLFGRSSEALKNIYKRKIL